MLRRCALVVLSLALLWPSAAMASVQALFNPDVIEQGPFPSDRFTVPNPANITRLQISLPLPDCTTHPSDCNDLRVINTLDGFNVNPRVSIPFNGPIDVKSVNSETVFLVELGKSRRKDKDNDRKDRIVGINQVVWDPATNTLHAESNHLLEQDAAYALVVTDGVHDSVGNPVQPSAGFARLLGEDFDTSQAYLAELSQALDKLSNGGRQKKEDLLHHIVVASIFTTRSVTAILEKIRRQIGATTPAPADFLLGPGGTRTVFPLSTVTGLTGKAETSTAPSFTKYDVSFVLTSLKVIPGAVGELAFGKYSSPDYEVHPGEFIPPVSTLTGVPVVQRTNDIYFDLVIPSGPKPSNGWPVAIFGHGATSGNDAVFFSAAKMASHGIATIGLNVVGHGCGQTGLGCGPLSTFTVTQSGGSSVTFLAGGRSIDQDGDGDFKLTEGLNATPPHGIIGSGDGLRQTVADLMQLVRVIQVGVDVDGDGIPDLDPSRIYYYGQSLGGIYGTLFLAVEPDVRVGVPNVAGGPLLEASRLSPVNRAGIRGLLASRVPSLLNIGGGTDFNENFPLRDQPPVINTVPGADAIQQFFDRSEWNGYSANAVGYAPYIRKEPLEDVPAKSTIFQFARGDEQVPNPTTTAILRAGDLADVATYYRNDLAVAADPLVPTTPHVFLLRVPPRPFDSNVYAIALHAQEQIATFFESDGDTVINPDPAFFEVPIVPPLPETCDFLFPLPPSPPFPSYLFFPSCP
jgi:hypothetical protein